METHHFKTELITHIPAIRALANSLCRHFALADDLAQETLVRAWASRKSYMPGTNMRAWLFTILRNAYYSHLRQQAREVQDVDGEKAKRLVALPRQESELELQDLIKALQELPPEQREAILLVGASGCTYEEAADICACAIGTIKSRVSRARSTLLAMMEGGIPMSTAASVKVYPFPNFRTGDSVLRKGSQNH